jgi:hypothetical protein
MLTLPQEGGLAHAARGMAWMLAAGATPAGRARHMSEGPHIENGMTISIQRGRPARCTICGRRVGAPRYRIVESEPPEGHQQTWVACAECTDAVLEEVGRAALQSPLRVRIAVGIVAARRRPVARPAIWSEQFWEDLDDAAMDRVLKRFVWVAFAVKMLSVVAIGIYVAVAVAH